jgi:hypothetical protein
MRVQATEQVPGCRRADQTPFGRGILVPELGPEFSLGTIVHKLLMNQLFIVVCQ